MRSILLVCIFFSIIIFIISLILFFKKIYVSKTQLRYYLIRLSISFIFIILVILLLEIIFSKWVIQSDGIGYTLSSKLWFKKYWYPINSFGFRDNDHKKIEGKKIVIIIGDSFAAGPGIKKYTDRFSNVLQNLLGNNYEVINISRNGWSSEDEYNGIQSYPTLKPDIGHVFQCQVATFATFNIYR